MKRIVSIEATNSQFFESPIRIEFSDKLNCLMGGRGTGKSTLLYMIQSAVESDAEQDKTVYDILRANLGDGTVVLTITDDDGKGYKIIKTFNDEPQPYHLQTEDYVAISKISKDISCDVYRASSLERIGLSAMDRLALVDKMLAREIGDMYHRIKSKQIELSENAHAIKSENARVTQVEKRLVDYQGAEELLEAHKSEQPMDIGEEKKEKFENADKEEKLRLQETEFVNEVQERIQYFSNRLEDLNEEIHDFVGALLMPRKLLNDKILQPAVSAANSVLNTVMASNKDSVKQISALRGEINAITESLRDQHERQQNEFVQLKQAFDKHKTYINNYNKLSKRVAEKAALEKKLSDVAEKRDRVKKQRVRLIAELNAIKQEIYKKRMEKVEDLNDKFKGAIRVTLAFSGITDEYQTSLMNALRGSGMKYNTLVPIIVQNFTPDRFAAIVHAKDEKAMKTIAGIDKVRSEVLFAALHETDHIYSIEALYTPDLPEFMLRIRVQDPQGKVKRESYQATDQLSTGQRCTTVLPIVFAVSDNPLIIDQPEDNLDNRYITDTIHGMIRELKGRRQLLFITHNPNIPVLADAEQNVFLEYSGKRAAVLNQGSVAGVKDNILNLLEGGREAFDRRKVLYGA